MPTAEEPMVEGRRMHRLSIMIAWNFRGHGLRVCTWEAEVNDG